MARKLVDRLKTYAANSARPIRYRFSDRDQSPQTGPLLFADLQDPRLERYLYWLLKMFDIAGWRVSLRLRPWLLLNLRNCSEYIYDIENLGFSTRRPDSADVVITDRKGAEGAIVVSTDYFSSQAGGRGLKIPFFMHPDVYHTELYKDLPALQDKTPRRIKVFLGGNLGDAYDTSLMRNLFGLMNRSEVTKTVIDAFQETPGFFEIKSSADADAVLSGETVADVVVMRQPWVSLPKWMELLAASEFFVAPPGVIMPFSHNIIEAMAVGTIPITQYGHLFDPPLLHGETCLHFSDSDELVENVRKVVESGRQRVDGMRENVVDHYQEHLDPVSVVNKIHTSRKEIDTLYLISGHLSVKALQARTSAAQND